MILLVLKYCVVSSLVNLAVSTIEDYSSQSLTSVPSGIPTTATELILVDNELTVLGANEFSSLTALAIFDASENRINTVDSTAFQGTVIEELYLDNNDLTAVPALTGFTTINKFFMRENKLVTIDFSLLIPFCPDINHLRFDGNPTLTTFLNQDAFSQLTGLMTADFKSCNLRSRSCDLISNTPANVRLLYLSNNSIASSHLTCFASHPLPKLKILDLDYNDLTVFPDFDGTTANNIQQLWLGKNQLTSLDTATITTPVLSRFPKMKKILLWNNKITSLQRLLSPGDTTIIEQISLMSNDVNSVATDTFDGITTLTNLVLSYNELNDMPGCLPDFSLTTLKLEVSMYCYSHI